MRYNRSNTDTYYCDECLYFEELYGWSRARKQSEWTEYGLCTHEKAGRVVPYWQERCRYFEAYACQNKNEKTS